MRQASICIYNGIMKMVRELFMFCLFGLGLGFVSIRILFSMSSSGSSSADAGIHSRLSSTTADSTLIDVTKREIVTTISAPCLDEFKSKSNVLSLSHSSTVSTQVCEFALNGFAATITSGLSKDQMRYSADIEDVFDDFLLALPVAPASGHWGLCRINERYTIWSNDDVSDTCYSPQFSGKGVDVYVIDTGIDTTHPDFENLDAREVRNIYNCYGDVTTNTDGNGHGTHVAGIIGGLYNGVASESNLYGVKVMDNTGSGLISDIIAGLEFIAKMIQERGRRSLVSISLGSSCSNTCSYDALNIAVQDLIHGYDVIVVVAAGNNYSDSNYYSPASALGVLTVAASNIHDQLASFSNFGPGIDIVGPGVAIKSACSSHKNLAMGKCLYDNDGTIPYLLMSGTSMAAPFVTGVLAQILQLYPNSMQYDKNAIKSYLLCIASENYLTNFDAITPKKIVQKAFKDRNCEHLMTSKIAISPAIVCG